jgi:hypothetical protein
MKLHKQKRRNKDSPSRKNQIDRVVENLIAQIGTNRDYVWQIELAQI